MDGAHEASDPQVARLLDINATRAASAVLALRREVVGPSQSWTLGPLGTFELDPVFVGVVLTAASPFGHQRITTSGRLWSAHGVAVVRVEVTLASAEHPPSELAITPQSALPPLFDADRPGYRALATAALDELAEELLYHARFVVS